MQPEPELRKKRHRAQGCSAEEPEALDLSGRGRSRHPGGSLQRHDKKPTSAEQRCDAARATAAHRAGQHRQQRSGPEEPACRGATKASDRLRHSEPRSDPTWPSDSRTAGGCRRLRPDRPADSLCSRTALRPAKRLPQQGKGNFSSRTARGSATRSQGAGTCLQLPICIESCI